MNLRLQISRQKIFRKLCILTFHRCPIFFVKNLWPIKLSSGKSQNNGYRYTSTYINIQNLSYHSKNLPRTCAPGHKYIFKLVATTSEEELNEIQRGCYERVIIEL